MPRAEVGSTKYIANQMKAKGLQRLRWYCQACSRQMRDENGFKCHVASESHVRQMQLIGEDPRKAINDFSNQFLRDFVQLLRTGHGEKAVNVNHFYQEYISNKQHVHMNATKWSSLTEFAKYLGREGICRVGEDEKNEGRTGASGLTISWIDNSPEALRRQEAIRKKERQDRGDEEREQRMIQEQIRKARRQGMDDGGVEDEDVQEDEEQPQGDGIKRKEGEKVVLTFGAKKLQQPPTPPLSDNEPSPSEQEEDPATSTEASKPVSTPSATVETEKTQQPKPAISMSFGSSTNKARNVFSAASKRNAFSGAKKPSTVAPQKPMSEAERIMKEELERKRQREERGGNVFKKQRIS
jgi:DNA/RNA-binding protein KIN17